MTPIQSKRIAKVVQVLASLKTADSDEYTFDNIAHGFAKAVWVDAYLSAVGESTGENNGGTISDDMEVQLRSSPWSGNGGPNSPGLETYAPTIPDEFLSRIDQVLTKAWGKDAILSDYAEYNKETGKDADTYGWYLGMQELGHGVGLYDDGYDSTLKEYASGADGASGSLGFSPSGDIIFSIYYGGTYEADVTGELESYLISDDEDDTV